MLQKFPLYLAVMELVVVAPFQAVIEKSVSSLEAVLVIVVLEVATKPKLSSGYAPLRQTEFGAWYDWHIVSEATSVVVLVQKNFFVRPTADNVDLTDYFAGHVLRLVRQKW